MELHHPREMCNIRIPPSGRFTKIKENLNDFSVWKGTLKDGKMVQMLKELINVTFNSKAGFVSICTSNI